MHSLKKILANADFWPQALGSLRPNCVSGMCVRIGGCALMSLFIASCNSGNGLIGPVAKPSMEAGGADAWQEALTASQDLTKRSALKLADALKFAADAEAAEARGDAAVAEQARRQSEAAFQEASTLRQQAETEIRAVQGQIPAIEAEQAALQKQLESITNASDPLSIQLQTQIKAKQDLIASINAVNVHIAELSAQWTALNEIYKNHAIRPVGFGTSGTMGWEKEAPPWFYTWGIDRALVQTPREKGYLPMIYGGPGASSCGPNNEGCTCLCRTAWHNCDPSHIKGPSGQWIRNPAACVPGGPAYCQQNLFGPASGGMHCAPGCANPHPTYDATGKVTGTVLPAECTSEELERHWRSVVLNPATASGANPFPKGRVWLVFNEPEDFQQAFLIPERAAKVYDFLYDKISTIDPAARFYVGGTQPGIHGNDWIVRFFRAVTKPVHGVTVHGYFHDLSKLGPNGVATPAYYASWYRGDKMTEVLASFSKQLDSLSTASGQPLGALPILITEWAGLPGGPADRCGGMNNLTNVMRPVAQWLTGFGATEFNYAGAGWFYAAAGDSQFGSSELYTTDLSGVTDVNCLGKEYYSYQWNASSLMPVPSLYKSVDYCERIEVSLDRFANLGADRRAQVVAYNADTGVRIGFLKDLAGVKAATCPLPEYFGGDDNWHASYYRYFDINTLRKRVCAANGAKAKIKVRFETPAGIPQTAYSPAYDFGACT